MIRKYTFSILALMTVLSLTGCLEDDSTLGTKVVGDIDVSGIESTYEMTAYVGEHLQINPTVETGYDESDMEYQWILLDSKTGSTTEDGDTIQPTVIGTEKNLDYEVAISPGNYQIRFIAMAKSNSYKSYTSAQLVVSTNFTSGFYVLKETTDGKTDIDLLSSNGSMGENLIEQIDGASLDGAPLDLTIGYDTYYINPDNDDIESTNVISVTTEEGSFVAKRTTDLMTVFDRSSILYDEMSESEIPVGYLDCGSFGYLCFLTSEGIYVNYSSTGFGTECSGQYGLPTSECSMSKFYTHDVSSYGGLIFWDTKTSSIMRTSYNLAVSALTYSDNTGKDITQNQTSSSCLHIGYNQMSGKGTTTTILADNNTGERHLYTTTSSMSGIFLSSYRAIPSTMHLSKATAFSTNGKTAKYIYGVDNGELYACNFGGDELTETPLKPEGIGSGETITYVGNQFWNGSISGGTKFDYLVVGTQKGNEYNVYMYKTIGGVPEGEPVKTIHGTGKLKKVSFLNSKFDATDFMFGYYVYNANY